MYTKFSAARRGYQAGFTLIETFVAITILVVAIVGPMTIAARGLQAAFFAKEQLVAVYLAQEGVEFVRMMRDENAIAGQVWLSGIHASCMTADGCGVDIRDMSFRSCSTLANCQLNYDDGALLGDRGMYTYVSGDPSQFTRVVYIDETAANQEAEITVTVSWQSTIFPKTITVRSLILNQYDNF